MLKYIPKNKLTLVSGNSNVGVIIVAVLTLSGVIILPFLNTYIPKISGGPELDYEIIPNSKDPSTKIYVKNVGISSATNVTLTVITPKKILQILSTFSTEEMQTPSFDGTVMKVVIPKITHGTGSLVEIKFLMNTAVPGSYTNYTGYAVYDQGSTSAKIMIDGVDQTSDTSSILSYFLIAYTIIIPPYYFSFTMIMNKRKLNRFINQLIEIRYRLKNDIPFEINRIPSKVMLRRMIYEIPDYLLVENFIELLEKCSNSQDNMKSQNDLNKKCLESIETVLQKIDWKKYEKTNSRYMFYPIRVYAIFKV